MVLMNGSKRARNISSTIANADNRCNGGMKKAGMPPTAGWMRKLNGVQKNYYFRRTVERDLSKLPGNQTKTCEKSGKTYYFLKNTVNQMPRPFSQKKL